MTFQLYGVSSILATDTQSAYRPITHYNQPGRWDSAASQGASLLASYCVNTFAMLAHKPIKQELKQDSALGNIIVVVIVYLKG